MRNADRLFLVGLFLAGIWIWMRQASFLTELVESLPLLCSLPLFAWFGSPWKFTSEPFRLHQPSLAFAGVALIAGLMGGLIVFLSLSWVALLWAWLHQRILVTNLQRAWRLLPLVLLAFPWISFDLPTLGWHYRLSAAWSAEHFNQLIGFLVQREGTQIFVQSIPFDVSPACSGIKTLQAMLVAGTALCFLKVGRRSFYWICLMILPLIAWMANTARVFMIIAIALSVNPEFASGWFHTTGSWLVLMVMFGLTWAGIDVIIRLKPETNSA